MTYFREFCYVNSSCIRKSISLMFISFSKNKFTLLLQNSVTDVSVDFRPPFWSSSRWAPALRPIQTSISLGKKPFRISRIRNIPLTWIFARVFLYVPPFISQILDFIHRIQIWRISRSARVYLRESEASEASRVLFWLRVLAIQSINMVSFELLRA